MGFSCIKKRRSALGHPVFRWMIKKVFLASRRIEITTLPAQSKAATVCTCSMYAMCQACCSRYRVTSLRPLRTGNTSLLLVAATAGTERFTPVADPFIEGHYSQRFVAGLANGTTTRDPKRRFKSTEGHAHFVCVCDNFFQPHELQQPHI